MEPNTNIPINYLNNMINLPNGAESEVIEEMKKWGIELSVSTYVEKEQRNEIPYSQEILQPMVKAGKIGALYVVSNP